MKEKIKLVSKSVEKRKALQKSCILFPIRHLNIETIKFETKSTASPEMKGKCWLYHQNYSNVKNQHSHHKSFQTGNQKTVTSLPPTSTTDYTATTVSLISLTTIISLIIRSRCFYMPKRVLVLTRSISFCNNNGAPVISAIAREINRCAAALKEDVGFCLRLLVH